MRHAGYPQTLYQRNMKIQIVIILVVVLIFQGSVFASDGQNVNVVPIDCGPIAREKFGVVFSAFYNNVRQTYFVKGSASTICPIVMNADILSGTVYDLCQNYTPPDKNECGWVKEFVLKVPPK